MQHAMSFVWINIMLKKLVSLIAKTFMHPQWLVFRDEARVREKAVVLAKGHVLDIGCADQSLKPMLSEECSYTGLDYPGTVNSMYGTRPMIFGDAQTLPVKSASMDTIILLEVLEHVPDIDAVISEALRVLKQDGLFLFSMPFLYPVHDSPFDFQRLTIHGLYRMMDRHSFEIVEEQVFGSPIETAGLLANLAMTKTVLNSMKKKSPVFLLGLLLPLFIPTVNIFATILGKIAPADEFMPTGYMLVLRKKTE